MRRRIIGRLAAGPLDVGGLAAGMPIGRTAVSMHLRVLKAAGLVGDLAVGNRRVYHLEPEALRQVRDHLDWYWERSLTAYQRAAEERAAQYKAARHQAGEQRMTAEPEIVVAKTVLVNAPLAVAFEVFVDQEWWPVDTHHLAEPHGREVVLEPFAGGRWYERAADGTETDWGTVLAWQPPYRLLLTWQVSPRWTYEEDPGRGSQIEVTFTPEGPDTTRVDFTHRHLERYGPEAERMRRILDAKGGGPLTAFARHLTARIPAR
jgi:Activator of Hsp90 ATPase homolog 1-like protein/Bacterial regulatory protein, arsR family